MFCVIEFRLWSANGFAFRWQRCATCIGAGDLDCTRHRYLYGSHMTCTCKWTRSTSTWLFARSNPYKITKCTPHFCAFMATNNVRHIIFSYYYLDSTFQVRMCHSWPTNAWAWARNANGKEHRNTLRTQASGTATSSHTRRKRTALSKFYENIIHFNLL